MKKMRVGAWISLLFCPAVFLLTGCLDYPPKDPKIVEEKWIRRGLLYSIVITSGKPGVRVYRVGEYDRFDLGQVTNPELILDIEAAATRTLAKRSATSAGPSGARAAAAPVSPVRVIILDRADRIDQFDPATNKITATLDLFGSGLPGQPVDMDVTPDGKFAVVTAFAAPPDVPYALVIDLTTFKIAAKINLPSGAATGGVAITPDGLFAYIATTPLSAGNDSTVYVIDIEAGTVATSIVIPGNANLDRIVMKPDGVAAYLTSDFSGNSSVYVIDMATNTLALSASTQGSMAPLQMAMHPDGSRLYLVPTDGSAIKILTTATHTISRTIAGAGQGGLLPVGKVAVSSTAPVFTQDGRFLFFLGTPESISMIDTATDTQVATLPAPPIGPFPGRPRFTNFVVPDQ